MARIAGVNIPTGKRVCIALTYIHGIGRTKAVEICDGLEAAEGARFAAPKLLREMAAKGQSFYGRFGAGAKAA